MRDASRDSLVCSRARTEGNQSINQSIISSGPKVQKEDRRWLFKIRRPPLAPSQSQFLAGKYCRGTSGSTSIVPESSHRAEEVFDGCIPSIAISNFTRHDI